MSSPSVGAVKGFGGSQMTIIARTAEVVVAGLPPGRSVALTLV
jgi:hypothetical protein